MKNYNKFWDKFDTILYEEILRDRKDVLQIRINKDVKDKFKSNCNSKGGMGKVLNVFINEFNNKS